MAEEYNFPFSEKSVYAHVRDLLLSFHHQGGVVLDLGCGYGALAEVCRAYGFEYVGCDVAGDGLDALASRGFEVHVLDLSLEADLARLPTVVASRPLAAVLMLDVIEHLTQPDLALAALHDLARTSGVPLIASIPNVTHYDVGVKLMLARWDMTPTGLLDRTHVQFFSEARLTSFMGEQGWSEVDRRDFVMLDSDQHFPPDLTAFLPDTTLHSFLRNLRDAADDDGQINQFVRAYLPGPRKSQDLQPERSECFLSVLVRSQGLRSELLQETLLSLSAQDDEDFEVIVLAHGASPRGLEMISLAIEAQPRSFRDRIRLEVVPRGGSRGRPLNYGVRLAHGQYIAVVDDDDVVFGHYVAEFHRLARRRPGRVLRTVVASQDVRECAWPDRVGFQPLAPIETPYPATFSLTEHFYENHSPLCGLAFPRSLFRDIGLTFDEDLPVLEDWDVLLQAAMMADVYPSGEVTSLYRRWKTGENSSTIHTQEEWLNARHAVIGRLDQRPLLLPPGSVSELRSLQERLIRMGGHETADDRIAELSREVNELRAAREALLHHVAVAEEDARRIRAEFIGSTSWRVTRPLRALSRGRALRADK